MTRGALGSHAPPANGKERHHRRAMKHDETICLYLGAWCWLLAPRSVGVTSSQQPLLPGLLSGNIQPRLLTLQRLETLVVQERIRCVTHLSLVSEDLVRKGRIT